MTNKCDACVENCLVEDCQVEHSVNIRKARDVVQDKGVFSVLEDLSLPHSRTDPALHPYLSIAVLNALDVSLPIESLVCLQPIPRDQINVSPLSLCISNDVLGTGCESLNGLLGGGIPMDAPAIFEVSGAAGAGKTQLMMQLALMCACPVSAGGLDSQSIYVSTEGTAPLSRFLSLSEHLSSHLSVPHKTQLAKRVIIETIRTSEDLLNWALWRLPYLLRVTGARLLIIDSIAALYRPEFDDAMLRANHLARLIRAIRIALIPLSAVCVCVNQVSQAVDRFSGNLDKIVPALGASWSGHVSTRIFIARRFGGHREAKILHSSYLPDDGRMATFLVAEEGIIND